MKKIYLFLILGCIFYNARAGTEISTRMTLTVDCRSMVTGMNAEGPEGIVASIQDGGYVKVKLRLFSANNTVQSTPVFMCQSTVNSTSDNDYIANEILGEELSFSYVQEGFVVHVKSGKDIWGRLQYIVPVRPSGSDHFASTNYPNTKMDDVYTDWFRLSLIPISNYTLTDKIKYYDNVQRFELEIISKNATVRKIAIPGIGIIRPFNNAHPCSSQTSGDEVCNCLQTLKNAGNKDVPSVILAAHRGSWGSNEQAGPPENSASSIRKAKAEATDIIEVDLMMTKDKQLICMHDYNLERLTNYGGTAYIFNKTYAEIQNLKLRNRDGTISNEGILRFNELLDIVKNQNLVLMIDIKELQARMKKGICVANCGYQTAAKQQESWFEILSLCCSVIQNKNAFKNVIFKTYYTPEVIFPRFEQSKREKMLITPMLISKNFNNDIQQLCQYIDNWIAKGGNLVAYFETDFFNSADVQLKSFSRNGRSYVNVLHYLSSQGYRGGIFSEEPVGRKGVVNRWAEWKMKDTETDFRADYSKLMDIPYADKMVITTDRVDIWKQIIKLQK